MKHVSLGALLGVDEVQGFFSLLSGAVEDVEESYYQDDEIEDLVEDLLDMAEQMGEGTQ